MNEIIKAEHLTLQFEDQKQETLIDISLKVNQGERVLLLGPSGSGKSTLTFCLNGLYPKDLDGTLSGKMFIKEKEVSAYRPGEISQEIGVVFQDPESQFCMLTVEDEIAFGLENIGVDPQQMDRRIEKALQSVGMMSYRYEMISTLSGGWKQKLALACVIALEPTVMILDEPTANLDPIASREFVRTIEALQNELNFTLMVIEHQLDQWMPIIDRCLILNREGSLIFDGKPAEGFNQHYAFLKNEGIWLPRAFELGLQWKQKGIFVNSVTPLVVNDLLDHVFVSRVDFPPSQIKREHNEPILTARNISVLSAEKVILKDMTLDLYKGEVLAIVGPNGAGKTTLSQVLASIKKADIGEVWLKGKPVQSYREDHIRQIIGYVFQNPEHQFITDTVCNEIAFGLKMQRLDQEQIEDKVRDIIDVCQLQGLENAHPFSLSQGQKRRLSVATMIVDEQQILILDEPTFGQDAKSTEELMNLLLSRNQKGCSIMMITHDVDLVHQYAHRVIALKDGAEYFKGSPDELWDKGIDFLTEAHLNLPFEKQIKHELKRSKGILCFLNH
ncbi:energy-coupling factor transport system ATP-binding protein [Bacillus oleivorans]|uniref:Energy-coupling factor transport system ATP-binding protein n=1 Tax=Bacillus oleivorans TaxID=1448271 RepID=A0A285CKF6_9BACI|nr:ABC transporter ATP-binding protein [Bacillus oleivorans]SNX68054.1 energy-coupling factor transport system ATP-binding protein [Bacillus oleivorans]